MKKGFYLFGTIKMLSYFFLSSRNLVWLDLSIRIDFFQPYSIQAWIKSWLKGISGNLENLKYFSVSCISILWSIWTYRNMATVKGDPLPATNVVMYSKSLIFMCGVANSSE